MTLPGLAGTYGSILADPPWKFQNGTGKIAPGHKRLHRYETMALPQIMALPVQAHAADVCHLYLWVPNALLREGLTVMEAWGFTYKTQLIWFKVRKDGGPDRRCCGFYYRNTTESVLFGVRGRKGRNVRTLPPFNEPNAFRSVKREHSRKPDELFDIIERKSPGPHLELFARGQRAGWTCWGDEAKPEADPALLERIAKAVNGPGRDWALS